MLKLGAKMGSYSGHASAVLVVLYTCTIFMAGRWSRHMHACQQVALVGQGHLHPSDVAEPGATGAGSNCPSLLDICTSRLQSTEDRLSLVRRDAEAALSKSAGDKDSQLSSLQSKLTTLEREAEQAKNNADNLLAKHQLCEKRLSEATKRSSSSSSSSSFFKGGSGDNQFCKNTLKESEFSSMLPVSRSAFVDEFLSYYPPLDGGKSVYIMRRDRGELRRVPAGDKDGNVALGEALSGCSQVDVVIATAGAGRCLAIVEANRLGSYHVTRFVRGERRPGKFDMVSRVYRSGAYKGIYGKAPHSYQIEMADRMLVQFMQEWKAISRELTPLLKRITKHHNNTVLAMCVNMGNIDLLYNFLCSAKEAKIDISNLFVFGSDHDVVDAVRSLGIEAYYNEALGSYPADAVEHFGDHHFAKIMFLKSLAAYIPLRLGFNVLFQDADLLWYKDPLPYFFQDGNDGFDTYWQDDGARSVRFGPFMANTGFFFLRSNERVWQFVRGVLYAYDRIINWASHQAMLDQVLADIHSQLGMTVKVLPMDIFPSGMMYQNPGYMQKLRSGAVQPYLFHMCWTSNKDVKLKQFKEYSTATHKTGWLLTDECTHDSIAEHKTDKTWLNACCKASKDIRK